MPDEIQLPEGVERETCNRCGRDCTIWSASSPLWNAVMRGGSINGRPEFNDMVCPTCFAQLAEEQGIATRFRVSAEQVNVELEVTTPSGRVWDEVKWLWVDGPASTIIAQEREKWEAEKTKLIVMKLTLINSKMKLGRSVGKWLVGQSILPFGGLAQMEGRPLAEPINDPPTADPGIEVGGTTHKPPNDCG